MWVLPWSVIFRRFTAIMFDESQSVFSFMFLFTLYSACASFLLVFVGMFIFFTCVFWVVYVLFLAGMLLYLCLCGGGGRGMMGFVCIIGFGSLYLVMRSFV